MPTRRKQLVVCVDDSGRPNEIPIDKWIERGEVYTIKKVKNSLINGHLLIFEEIDLIGCYPYEGFAGHRFLPI